MKKAIPDIHQGGENEFKDDSLAARKKNVESHCIWELL
jgi:hypothetical protein